MIDQLPPIVVSVIFNLLGLNGLSVGFTAVRTGITLVRLSTLV
jgi:hypothetical protein